jgi:ribose transport system ATP-binding protein
LGENGAGKSTFIKLLAGVLRPDSGEITLDGEPLVHGRRQRHGTSPAVGAVFQELSLIPDLTVAENVWIGREPLSPIGGISVRRLRQRTDALFADLGIDGIESSRQVRNLSVAERHLVEIAKVLSTRPRVVIFDESTSALGPSETEWLLRRARQVAAAGGIVLFISHRLAEVQAIADCVTVFRGGRSVGFRTREEYSEDELVTLMLARKLERFFPPKLGHTDATSETPALRVRGLTDDRRLSGVDFDLGVGEILGLGGLQGQGQAQLLLALYGAHPIKRGTVEIMGRPTHMRRIHDALFGSVRVALVPEDRRNQGLLLDKSVRENVSLAVLPDLARMGVVDKHKERTMVERAIAQFQIVARNAEQQVRWLSGGNQQKVVIAKLLLTDARLLLLYDVTRGVDVGTKEQIFTLMRSLAARGYSMLFYSTDASELINMCDRIAVMAEGQIVATLSGEGLTEENLIRAAVQGTVEHGAATGASERV